MGDGTAEAQGALFGEGAGEQTWTVGELGTRIGNVLAKTFRGGLWVRGEVHGLSRSRPGHCYFDLVEKEPSNDRSRAKLRVVLLARERETVDRRLGEVGVELADGLEVRIRATLDFYTPQGSLQLRMSDVDPAHTLGRLAADRERLLRVLAADGLLDRNAALDVPLVPLRIGLVTSEGSAAAEDFVAELHAGGYAWRVTLVHTRVQGEGAEHRVARALRSLAGRSVDVVALVRGGGSRTELAVFDSEVIARTIAAMPVPVLTGIGHEIDRSIADDVAHTCFKTPTACAAWLVDAVRSYDEAMEARWAGVVHRAELALTAADERLSTAARQGARGTRGSLGVAEHVLATHARRLGREGTACLDRTLARLDRATGKVEGAAATRVAAHEERLRLAATRLAPARVEALLSRHGERLTSVEARVRALDPRRVLERGFTMTRGADGRLVRRAADLAPGAELVTDFPDGAARSTVASVHLPDEGDPQ